MNQDKSFGPHWHCPIKIRQQIAHAIAYCQFASSFFNYYYYYIGRIHYHVTIFYSLCQKFRIMLKIPHHLREIR